MVLKKSKGRPHILYFKSPGMVWMPMYGQEMGGRGCHTPFRNHSVRFRWLVQVVPLNLKGSDIRGKGRGAVDLFIIRNFYVENIREGRVSSKKFALAATSEEQVFSTKAHFFHFSPIFFRRSLIFGSRRGDCFLLASPHSPIPRPCELFSHYDLGMGCDPPLHTGGQ